MKNREIDGWVYDGELKIYGRFPDNFHEMKGVSRAKLIIEIPEKTITISESDFLKLAHDPSFSYSVSTLINFGSKLFDKDLSN